MARTGRHRRGGRVTPKATRPRRDGRESFQVIRGEAEEPDLMANIRAALATGDPLDLLAEVSGLLAVVDPRSQSPLERVSGEEPAVSAEMLTETFADVDRRETSALLAIAEFP